MENPVTPALTYRDPRAAIAWLERAFGFTQTMAIEPPPDQPTMGHYEMRAAGGLIMIGSEWNERTTSPASLDGANTQSLHVRLPAGIDEHCEHARAAGAQIIQEPRDEFFGDRIYRALDGEGHQWTFAMRVRDVSKAEAEAAIGMPIMATEWQ